MELNPPQDILMKPEGVEVRWSTKHQDLVVKWDREAGRANPRFIIDLFTQEILDELDSRGYDITTLQFRIKKK